MVDSFEEAADAQPRRRAGFGRVALTLALLPGLGLALGGALQPG